MSTLFSIIVVSLNAGDDLVNTLKSIEVQSIKDYEVIIKDGGSTDGSIESMNTFLVQHPAFKNCVKFYQESDKSIYDAMNQAVKYASGEYLYFLNCGDFFYFSNVLEVVKEKIIRENKPGVAIFYGDIYDNLRKEKVQANPKIDAFACYRHVPCHQSCFYHKNLFSKRGYRIEYKVRADYEHFLWCFFKGKSQFFYIPIPIASYAGGGFSETKENRKRSKKEHKEITSYYFTSIQRRKYQLILGITLAPIRSMMAESKFFSRFYQRIKGLLYSRR